jgi:DNA-binding response OmpR family regulator
MAKLLLIDDDQFYRDFTEMVLSEFGYDVVSASSGMEGIKIIRNSNDIDLVISDLQMPPGDWGGIWVMEQLNEVGKVPGIILSEKGTVSKAVESIKMGAKDYVEKSKIESELIAVVEKVLLQKQSTNQAKDEVVSSYFEILNNLLGTSWDKISKETQTFLANAEQIYHRHAKDPQFDFSVGIIELSKAIEVECNRSIVDTVKQYVANRPEINVSIDLSGRSIELRDIDQNLMLGQISYILKRPFIRAFCQFMSIDYSDVQLLNTFLHDLRNKYGRNAAAHSDVISLVTFELLRSMVLGIGKQSPLEILVKFKSRGVVQ